MNMIFGVSPSTNGEPRMRLEIILRAPPEAMQAFREEGATLTEIGQSIMRGVVIESEHADVVSLTQVLYREMPMMPSADEPMKMFRELMDRIAPKREPWDKDQADGGGDPV